MRGKTGLFIAVFVAVLLSLLLAVSVTAEEPVVDRLGTGASGTYIYLGGESWNGLDVEIWTYSDLPEAYVHVRTQAGYGHNVHAVRTDKYLGENLANYEGFWADFISSTLTNPDPYILTRYDYQHYLAIDVEYNSPDQIVESWWRLDHEIYTEKEEFLLIVHTGASNGFFYIPLELMTLRATWVEAEVPRAVVPGEAHVATIAANIKGYQEYDLDYMVGFYGSQAITNAVPGWIAPSGLNGTIPSGIHFTATVPMTFVPYSRIAPVLRDMREKGDYGAAATLQASDRIGPVDGAVIGDVNVTFWTTSTNRHGLECEYWAWQEPSFQGTDINVKFWPMTIGWIVDLPLVLRL